MKAGAGDRRFPIYRDLVLAHYRRLYRANMQTDLPDTWERLINEHYHSEVLPMDAARGIHATEVAP